MKCLQAEDEENMELMNSFPDWGGKPYFPISSHYKKKFGEKVYKITVGTSEICPNRRGNDESDHCIFCDESGSAAYHLSEKKPLQQQIRENREWLSKRFNVNRFLVYFQPYTSTMEQLGTLEKNLNLALEEDKVSGLVLGTRPDCLPEKIFPLFRQIMEKTYLSIELGVQSFSDSALLFLRRGHTAQQSIEAIHRLHELSGVEIGIHLMFGLPDEKDSNLVETAQLINSLPISNVKLHNLHVLANTPLESLFQNKQFIPVELEDYAKKVVLFLEHLSPQIAVQRLAATANRWEHLVAPEWTKERMRPSQVIMNKMLSETRYQGKLYSHKEHNLYTTNTTSNNNS